MASENCNDAATRPRKKCDDIFIPLDTIQYTNVTDGQTDRHRPTASTALTHVASRGKNHRTSYSSANYVELYSQFVKSCGRSVIMHRAAMLGVEVGLTSRPISSALGLVLGLGLGLVTLDGLK